MISLNHAYEAVAAVSGYPTWAVMKAKLEARSSISPVHTVEPFPEGPQPWSKFKLGENNPTSLFYGPSDIRRQATMDALGRSFLYENGSKDGSKPYLRTIAVLSDGAPCLTAVEGMIGAEPEAFSRFQVSKESCDLSIFDLPLGQRYPSPEHRARIIDFISVLVASMVGSEEHSSDAVAIAEPVPRMVDAMYAICDRIPVGYEEGVLPEVDGILSSLGFSGSSATWWDASEMLSKYYLTSLAQWAAAQAVPSLSGCACILNQIDMNGVISSGERAVNVIARGLSLALREYPFLRGVRRPGERYAKVSVLEIVPTTGDPRVEDLLFLMAVNEYRLFIESVDADEGLRAVYKQNRPPRRSDPIRLLVSMSGASLALARRIADLMDDAVEKGREVAVFSDHLAGCYDLVSRSSSYFVYGAHEHAEVALLGGLFDLGDDHMNLVHDHMVGVPGGQPAGVPMLACRRKFHIVEKSAVMCPSGTR